MHGLGHPCPGNPTPAVVSWVLHSPRGQSLTRTDSISPGALLAFGGLGRGGEQQVLFLAWCPGCFSARECLHPTVLVLWHPSSTPKPGQSGLESRPETAEEVEALWAPVRL